tara:strand:- start:3102 stop:3314 length:213 start_codon:yes stop_codon:yes gene_type:complete
MFQVIIIFNKNIIHQHQYKNLKEISKELGMTYQQVADINCGRFKPKYISKNFIYQPEITIERIKNEISID